MATISSLSFYFLLLFSSISFLSNVQSQESGRGPHGLAQESPMAFSPEAFEFFNPKSPVPTTSCAESDCAPVSSFFKPMVTKMQESSEPVARSNGRGIGALGMVGIVFGCVVLVALAMGTYYVVVTRRENISRAKTVQPGV
ncbi:uncharacterized protein [Aristolochia californica]|uniref:uncharacterized protein n=1 Tax=Aristolochia californica TaxID=171875 RepID=UPI0035E1FDA5